MQRNCNLCNQRCKILNPILTTYSILQQLLLQHGDIFNLTLWNITQRYSNIFYSSCHIIQVITIIEKAKQLQYINIEDIENGLIDIKERILYDIYERHEQNHIDFILDFLQKYLECQRLMDSLQEALHVMFLGNRVWRNLRANQRLICLRKIRQLEIFGVVQSICMRNIILGQEFQGETQQLLRNFNN